jgi:N-acetylglucosamine-6-phosphate deacetylase
MLLLSGATLVLPDRLLSPGTLVIDDRPSPLLVAEGSRHRGGSNDPGGSGDVADGADDGLIVEIRPGSLPASAPDVVPLDGHIIVPGFVDVHVHGVDGIDTLGGSGAVRAMAARLPRSGVTAFCPTSVACAPDALRLLLDEVERERSIRQAGAARVLAAHLESNFINPAYCGAQPHACLRGPREGLERLKRWPAGSVPDRASVGRSLPGESDPHAFDGDDILRELERRSSAVGVVTLAPELDGALDLVAWLVARGHRVSLGHSGATYDEALAAVAAGARQATHLFNRMPPLNHRAPGLVGAALQADELSAEIICDGVHVHPALVRATVAAKRPTGVLAITDGTALAQRPVGARARLGTQTIVAGESAAFLEDGTMAGSTATMDVVFRVLVERVGLSLIDAATICATTPARAMGAADRGSIEPGAVADLTILGPDLRVVATLIGGRVAWAAQGGFTR